VKSRPSVGKCDVLIVRSKLIDRSAVPRTARGEYQLAPKTGNP
jgi:hypothetical protein